MAVSIELGVTEQLHDVAYQCEAEADELSERVGIEPD